MIQETSYYFRRAMDALETFKAAATTADIESSLDSSLRSFGYHGFMFATPFRNPDDTIERRRLVMRWPQSWREQYEQEHLVGHDAVAASFRTSVKSFRWSDIAIESSEARRVMDIAANDHGMRVGFCVPIHGLHAYEAGLSVAGSSVDDCDKANFAVELIAVYAFNRLSQLKASSVKKLTPRQREVLRWIAAGKTAWDVGAILNISQDTVKKTTASAMRRLNCHTRAQAVAEAIRRNEFFL